MAVTDQARALVISAVLLSGCNGGNETIPLQEFRVDLAPTTLIDGVARLQLKMNPTLVEHDGKTEAVLIDRVTLECSTDVTKGQVCIHHGDPDRSITIWLINHTNHLAAPLSKGTIVKDVLVDEGTYTSATISAISEPNVSDSEVLLTDGRACEVRLLATDGQQSIRFPLDLRIGRNEDWIITLTIDFTSTPPLDPAQCEQGYDLFGAVSAVEYVPKPNPIHGP